MVSLRDFSVLEPEPVIMRFGNGEDIQEVDLSVYPTFLSLKTGELVESYDYQIETIPMGPAIAYMAENLGKLNPRITEEFLWQKCSEKQVANNFTYILQRHLEERVSIARLQVAGRKKPEEPRTPAVD